MSSDYFFFFSLNLFWLLSTKLNHWCQNPAPVPRTQVGINAPFLWQLELSKGTDGCENCNVTLSVRYAHWSRCHMKSKRQRLKKTPQSYLVLLHIAGSITLFPQLLLPFLTSFVLFLPALLLLLVFCFAPPPPPQICCHLSCCGLFCWYFGKEIVSYERTCVCVLRQRIYWLSTFRTKILG